MAFHPYPRVIPSVFNRSGFGPPRGLTPASACPWVAHPASRPRRATKNRRLKDSLSLRLASKLNLAAHRDSLAHSTKGTPSHRQRCSDCSWARGFRRCFTPLSGCFSPFPHGTGSLSVMGECSALEGGPPCFGPGFTCPALLGDAPRRPHGSAYGALTRCGRPSHAVPLPLGFVTPPERAGSRDGAPRNPRAATPCRLHVRGFGLWSGFARRYSRSLG